MKNWAHIDLEDALPLLSRKFAANKIFKKELEIEEGLAKVYNEIRAKAIKSLENQSIDVIKSIMLQLVQAYRYENF
jgi:replicative DNA helicase